MASIFAQITLVVASLAICIGLGFPGTKLRGRIISIAMAIVAAFNIHLVANQATAQIKTSHQGCVDDEIIGSLQRREQRRRARTVMPPGNPRGD
jgi:hypothetical protein